jgi:signal peptidase II
VVSVDAESGGVSAPSVSDPSGGDHPVAEDAASDLVADARDGAITDSGASKRRILLVVVTALVVLIDQLTKHWALNSLQPGEVRSFLPGLDLTLTFNSGSAFSFASGGGPVIGIIAIGVMILVVVAGRGQRSLWAPVIQGLVLGGAIGNLCDRIFREPGGFLGGHVVDFLRLPHWPVFNVADMAITAGAVALVILSFTGKLDDPVRPR